MFDLLVAGRGDEAADLMRRHISNSLTASAIESLEGSEAATAQR